MASQGNQQALCQLYRHTFVPYSSAESRRMLVFSALRKSNFTEIVHSPARQFRAN